MRLHGLWPTTLDENRRSNEALLIPKDFLAYFRDRKNSISLMLMLFLCGSLAEARVTRVVIESREVVANGIAFGAAGPYEKLRGTAFFDVDPADPRNAVVFDLDKALRNADGLVDFSAKFFILKPVDMAKGNGELFFEVANAGNKLSLIIFNDVMSGDINNPTTPEDFGNGFLLRQGYTLAWVGWGANVTEGSNRLTVQVPIALENGRPITELILAEFADGDGAGGAPFSRVLPYETISTNPATAQAELRVRPSDSFRPSAAGIPDGDVVPNSQWSFAHCPNGPPGIPSPNEICFADRFQNNLVQQLIYRATKSPVMGLGYATTRDFVSFLRHATEDDVGTPNPVFGINRVLAFGHSMSAQYLRDFLYQGFNEDEQGQQVFDGVFIKSRAIRKLFLNFRFAQPRGSRQHADRFIPDNDFPRTYGVRPHPVTGILDGILKRPETDPNVIHADSANEYWIARSSLVDTDEEGRVDLVHPDNVRRYLFSSTQHASNVPSTFGIANRQCQQPSNPINYNDIQRALLVALDQWVTQGIEPPASRIPRIDDGTLVTSDQKSTGFPDIPGVTYNGLFNASGDRDFGPRVHNHSGVIHNLTAQPLNEHRVLVPTADAIGNDVAGIRHPSIQAPVATFTGWNLRTEEFTDGDLCDLNGSKIPLETTLAERLAAGDPRPSLEELYGDHVGYVFAVAEAALDLWVHRLMLLEDVFRIIQQADDSPVLK